jgi:uncharacterized protein YkwD
LSHFATTRLRPFVDALDARALLAGGVAAELSDGLLTILGTNAADIINVSYRGRGARAIVTVNNGPRYRVSQIGAIDIQGGAGNDVITVNDRVPLAAPTAVHAGSGFVQIRTASARDVIYGGSGLSGVIMNPAGVFVPASGPMLVNGVLHMPPASSPAYGNPPVSNGPLITTPVYGAPTKSDPPTKSAPPSDPWTPPTQITPDPTLTPAQTVAQVIALTNQDRLSNGLAALQVSSKLTNAAQIHANDMAHFELMDHTLPDAADPTLQSRAADVGYNFSWLGENIALNYTNTQTLETAWMNSAGHRANILDARYTEFGVAMAYDVLGQPYYCVVFGKPA